MPLLPPPPEVPVAPLGPLGLVGVLVGVVGTVGVGEVVLFGAQEAETLFTGPTPAGTIEAGGVPDGAVTVKVSVWPVSSVTVSVHWSAEADGIAAIPRTVNTEAAVKAAVFSFRRIDNLT